jgi:hypothetical protein
LKKYSGFPSEVIKKEEPLNFLLSMSIEEVALVYKRVKKGDWDG